MAHTTEQFQSADRLNVITQRVGFALWQLQVLENCTAQYFVLLAQAQKGMGLAAGNALIEKAQRKTFGNTINQMTKASLLSSELEARFTKLLDERNWLVHKSRASYPSAVHRDSSMETLLFRLDAIADETLTLIKEVAILTDCFAKAHGISEKWVTEEANRLLEQWYASDVV